MDDDFSFSIVGDLELYKKYDAFFPSDQVALLQLWDKISLPHEESKQICGPCIPIIGFEVDPNAMSVRMFTAKHSELINTCTIFTVRSACKTLREFQKLQGWINWALNIFPHLWPALCESYQKIVGKACPNASIQVNNTMRWELLWFIHHVEISNSIHMVCSAFYLGAEYGCDRIAIYSDNTNTVNMFSSLQAKPVCNSILVAAVDLAVKKSISTKVYYVCGKQNIIADYLSRFENAKALQLAPHMRIRLFQPPRNALGVVQKWPV